MQSDTSSHKNIEIRNILTGTAARKKLLAGVEAVSNAVSVTLGPRGRNVAIEKSYGNPLVTKDGVSVAMEVDLEDPFEQMGAKMVRDASKKTSDDAGDGTTTSTVLASYLYREGLKLVEAGFSPVFVKRGMDKALAQLDAILVDLSYPVQSFEHIAQVGTISANGDDRVGRILAEAIDKIGKDGVINIEESKGLGLEIEVKEGLQFDRGAFLTDFLIRDGLDISLENPYVFVTDLQVGDIRLLAKMLNSIVEDGRPVVLIAPDFSSETVAALFQNFTRGNLIAVPVRAPGFGDRQTQYLRDICTITGATFVTKDLSMKHEDVTKEQLGSAASIVVTRTTTTITGGAGDSEVLLSEIAKLRGEISRCGSEFDREKLQERLSKLTGGVCSIKVGAHTELEIKELKARIEDALHATRSAVSEGVVPGGGTALLNAGFILSEMRSDGALLPELTPSGQDEESGWSLVIKATEAPLRAICKNAGHSASVLINKVREQGETFMGVDARTGDVVDMIQNGILDPLRVVRHALINAVSVASTMLTSEVLICPVSSVSS